MQHIKCWYISNTIDDYHAITNRVADLRVNKQSKLYGYLGQWLTKDNDKIMTNTTIITTKPNICCYKWFISKKMHKLQI